MPLTGAGVTAAVMVGGVLSRFTMTFAVAVFPALSVAVPLTVWLAASVETVMGAGQVAMPEPESEQVNVTVTLELFQPLALGAGAATAVMAGGVLSIFTDKVAEAVLPALSVTDPVTGVVPSVATVMGAGQVPAIPESASEQVNVTVTLELFQPLALAAGDCTAVITGGVLSRLTVTLVVAVKPVVSVAVPEMT